MDKQLNILIIEDSEDDTLLTLRIIKKHYTVNTWERVDTSKSFEMAIDKKHWDLIISDNSMPFFNPLMALMILKKKGYDIPFILMSGTIGEEAAVDILKAGAHDFIQKGNNARLIPAIERELNEAKIRQERKSALESLQKSEETIRALFNAILDPVFLVDSHGRIITLNKKGAEMLRMDVNAVIGTTLYDHFRGTMSEQRRKKVEEALTTGKPIFFDEERDGVFLENIIYPVHGTSSMSNELAIFSRDVTVRKLAEKLEQEKARFELSEYMVSAFPAFASIIPQEARNILVRNFTERFEKRMRTKFLEELKKNVKTGILAGETFEFYLTWLSKLFSNIGCDTVVERDGPNGHIHITKCPWTDITSNNPTLCLMCRGLCMRSLTWISEKGQVSQKYSIMGGDERCSFEFDVREEENEQKRTNRKGEQSTK